MFNPIDNYALQPWKLRRPRSPSTRRTSMSRGLRTSGSRGLQTALRENVEALALAIRMPVLTRGWHDKSEKVKRPCCLIVNNVCKDFEDPAYRCCPSLPEPLVVNAVEQISDA
jgi:hypothetical protein